MKNLKPLSGKISYWDRIVDNKHQPSKAALLGIRLNVNNRFSIYRQHSSPNILESIPSSPFAAADIGYLKGCYSTSIEMSRLRSHIFEKQEELFQGECQYCNIGFPSTLDHYLPKDEFPEYSVLSINLLPCCPTCNTVKGEEWLDVGYRKFINFYYDILPNVQYLNCRIVHRGGVPKALFSLDISGVVGITANTIKSHFETLELTDKYRLKSNSVITDVRNAIKQRVTTASKVQIQNELRGEAADMRVAKGENYWRAILIVALSNSDRFLTDTGFI